TNGQVQFVTELAKIVMGLPGGKGAGIFWWGSEYQQLGGYNLAGFDRRSFFGATGEALPVARTFCAMTGPVIICLTVSNVLLDLGWPISGAGMILKSCTNLTQPVWADLANSIQNSNGLFSIALPLEVTGARFYRLRSN